MKHPLHLLLALLFVTQVFSQEIEISGIVSDNTGLPLPGANVVVKGTTIGTTSDFDGNYALMAKTDDTLIYTYVGYVSKEIAVGKKRVINVSMEPDVTLDEVVVTAMGIKRSEAISVRSSSSVVLESKLSGSVKGVDTGYSEPQSGQLTAGEINDLEKWDEWLKALKSEDNRKIQEDWQFQLEHKIEIHVKDLDSKPLNNVKVALYNSMNEPIMTGRTDFKGNVILFKDLNTKSDCDYYTVQVFQENRIIGKKITNQYSNLEFVLENRKKSNNNIDVMFTIDATGSMGDEINYLKSELKDIMGRLDSRINEKRVALTFYRDHGDDYVVKDVDFSTDIDGVRAFLAQQSAGGGGDYEEAVEEALKVSMSKTWQMDSKSKLLFLLLDAPPHYTQENVDIIKNQIKIAQEKGIKIIPIVASGANKNVEFLMRYFSVSTNGTYVFLTDDSGIGNSHIKPTTDDYKVEKLNDLIVRLIEKYAGVSS